MGDGLGAHQKPMARDIDSFGGKRCSTIRDVMQRYQCTHLAVYTHVHIYVHGSVYVHLLICFFYHGTRDWIGNDDHVLELMIKGD